MHPSRSSFLILIPANSHPDCRATHVKAGTCSNGSTITRITLERRALDVLRDKMMVPDAMAEFIVAYNEEVAAARAAAAREHIARAAELVEVDRK